MTQAIPASQFTSTTAGVISAGGNPLSLNSIWLSDDPAIPVGSTLNFPSASAVASFFGATNNKALLSNVYFNGFDNSNIKPDGLMFASFQRTPVSAWLRGGAISALALSALQALSGVLTITIDGVAKTSSSITLAGATSFSAAAALIQAGFATNPPIVTYDSQRGAFLLNSPTTGAGGGFTANTATNTALTVTAVAAGTVIQVGQVVVGAGIQANTYISAFVSGTLGGAGIYTLNQATTATATGVACTANASSMTVATGTLSAGLNLTLATGAVLSQGANASAEATVLNAIINNNTNWIPFMTMWEPTLTSKQAFAAWSNAQGGRYLYVCYDSDVTPAQNYNAPTSFGAIMSLAQSNGVCPIWGLPDKAAFLCGAIGSADYTELNGWVNYAYKHQTGLVPDVTDQTTYQNLLNNGYNCYCLVSLNNNLFNDFQPGSIPGPWKWVDNYIDQIMLLNNIQLADLVLLNNMKALPADQAGIEILRQSTLGPINDALNYGSIQAGINLTLQQIAEVNYAAGLKIDASIKTNGYYLQIIPSPGAVRANRIQSRTLWYTSAQGINTLHLSALNVQ